LEYSGFNQGDGLAAAKVTGDRPETGLNDHERLGLAKPARAFQALSESNGDSGLV